MGHYDNCREGHCGVCGQVEGLCEHSAKPGIDVPNYGAEAVQHHGVVEEVRGGTTANDVQHGGDHYKKRDYQHWDFVCDTKMPYLLGCATKYVARWKDKGGVEDLRKAAHYIQKADERGVRMGPFHGGFLMRFTDQLSIAEASIIHAICRGSFGKALLEIENLIIDSGVAPNQ